jgi:hypothetical protein
MKLSEILADPKVQESLQESTSELTFSDGAKHRLKGRLVGTGLFMSKSPETAINPPSGEVSFRTVMTLTPEGRDMLVQAQRMLPTLCPYCGYKHPTDMFRSNQQCELYCVACGYILQGHDYWSDVIE